jgi:hypothetical protein
MSQNDNLAKLENDIKKYITEETRILVIDVDETVDELMDIFEEFVDKLTVEILYYCEDCCRYLSGDEYAMHDSSHSIGRKTVMEKM